MKLRTLALYGLAALMLSACGTVKISTGQSGGGAFFGLLPDPIKDQATKDLIATAANMDAAVSINLIPAGSPLVTCPHDINRALGIEIAPGAELPADLTATLQIQGVASAGSVAYLKALQFSQVAANGIQIPESCAAAYGEIQLQGLGALFHLAGGLPITIQHPTPLPAPPAPLGRHRH